MSLNRESVVVITGAGSGIGRALARRIALEKPAGMALCDINDGALRETAESIPDVRISVHVADVSDKASMQEFVDKVIAEHGRVTHVINNAGAALGGSVSEVSVEDLQWLMGINFWGVVYGTKMFLPYLRQEESAHIVNISSIFGLVAPPGQAAYCASKFAVRGFSESLRHELEGTNVSVSVVHPGGVKTNIANNARIGEGVTMTDAELEERRQKYNENLAWNSPEKAAEIIVKGIKARNPRILVGSDAAITSVISRLFPKRYFAVIDRITGGRLRTTEDLEEIDDPA